MTNLATADGATQAMSSLPEPRTRQELQRARAGRRAAAVDALERWSHRHGVHPRHWIAPNVQPTTAAIAATGPGLPPDEPPGPLPRALIQAWLNACSDAELDAIVSAIEPLTRLHETLRAALGAERRG